MNEPSYRLLQSLPTDPHALLNLIYKATKGAGQSPDQEAFTTIGDLLRESIAPPDVSAALFRAAALIPGVSVIHHGADATAGGAWPSPSRSTETGQSGSLTSTPCRCSANLTSTRGR